MIKLISKIFEEKGYERKESPDLELFVVRAQKNYWLIISRDIDLDKILQSQVDLFVEAKKIIGEPGFDKNANLLILYKVEKEEKIKLELLLQIEEDAYHFKKSVIYYTEEEVAKLEEAIGASRVIDFVEYGILTDDTFELHKSSFNSNNYQSLLYRIAHKLPFVSINISQANNLESLEEINRNAIQHNDLNNLLEEEFFNLTDQDFATLSDSTILESLKRILPNEN